MVEINNNNQIDVGVDAVVVSIEKNVNTNKRSSIILINTSTGGQVLTIAIDGVAQVNKGIVLNAGGVWADSRDAGYYPTQAQITAISDAAGGKISIQERIEVN